MARKTKTNPKANVTEPPCEQQRDGAFALLDIVDKRSGGGTISIGRAFRRIPMIDRLHADGFLTTDEHKALKHYRHHADMIDRSPTRDSLDMRRGGHTDGVAFSVLNAAYLVRSVEAAVGSLVDLLRAVVVDDVSLVQYAVRRHGGVERTRYRKGKPSTSIEPEIAAIALTKLEMKIAASRVLSELAA